MRYKIKEIPEEGRSETCVFPGPLLRDALEGTDADLSASRAQASFELTRTDDEVLARGAIDAVVMLPCALCLRPTPVPVEVPFELLFEREGEEPKDPQRRGKDEEEDLLDELDVATHDGVTVDLGPTLRELVIVNMPIQPRCKEDCRGLCPQCGQDLNEQDCGHRAAAEAPLHDSRFDALKSIKLQS